MVCSSSQLSLQLIKLLVEHLVILCQLCDLLLLEVAELLLLRALLVLFGQL